VILFIEKTWFLWWMLAIFVAVRWFHLLSSSRTEGLDARALEEEERAYIVSWRILNKAQAIPLSEAKACSDLKDASPAARAA
jgi:hypothetical protein